MLSSRLELVATGCSSLHPLSGAGSFFRLLFFGSFFGWLLDAFFFCFNKVRKGKRQKSDEKVQRKT